MIDLLRIRVPFADRFVTASPDKTSGLIDLRDCQRRGCKMEAGEVTFSPVHHELDAGQTLCLAEVSLLRHPFEALPSSWSTLSFKVYPGGQNYYPFIELKASPAKLLQGHNVFGSCNLDLCIDALITAFTYGLPEMVDMLDFSLAECVQIDCTFTAHVDSESDRRNIIHALRNISNGQTRGSNSAWDTTAYFGKASRHKRLKAYLKHLELMGQLTDIQRKAEKQPDNKMLQRQIDAMTAPSVQDFAKTAVRFEASIMPRTFKRLAIPQNIWELEKYSRDFNGNLIQELWTNAWADIFATFEGHTMKTYSDDEVRNRLREHFKTETKNGFSYSKADRLFRFFRSFKHEGWDEIKATTPKASFFRNVSEISQVIPKAYLQNLQATASNVVPLVRVLNVDFSKQVPTGWQEPELLSQQMLTKEMRQEFLGLRLVS